MQFRILFLLALFLGRNICAQTMPNDSIQEIEIKTETDRSTRITVGKCIAPAILITAGSIGVATSWGKRIDTHTRDGIQEWKGNKRTHADDYIQYLPIAAHLSLGALGVKCRHDFKERFVIAATATASMAIMVNTLKWAVNEQRPDGSSHNSFPSGHSATAFMGAELTRIEYGPYYGLAAYAVATSTAFLRLYNNRHWLSDVLAGAGFGILSAQVGYWMFPVTKKIFRKYRKHDKRKEAESAFSFIPTYNPAERGGGFAFAAVF